MDIHPPTGKVHSIKEYLIHLSMVVLGILIALGLEQWRESRHHASLAAQATRDIKLEIESNQGLLRKVIPKFEKALPIVSAIADAQKAAIKAFEAKAGPVPEPKDDDLDLASPSLQSTAWEVATISQATNYMPREDLVKFSRVYTAQKFIMQAQLAMVRGYEPIAALGNFAVNAQPQQMMEQLKAVNLAKENIRSTLGSFKLLDEGYSLALQNAASGRALPSKAMP
jgi:hypothetical protein